MFSEEREGDNWR